MPYSTDWTTQTPDAGYAGTFPGAVWARSFGLWIITGFSPAVIQTSPDGETWTQQAAVTGELRKVVEGGGVAIAVGGPGKILRSVDGITWTPQTIDDTLGTFSAVFNGVAWGPEAGFVAVGDNGEIQTSEDGITWTQRQHAELYDLGDVAIADGVILAIGTNGAIVRAIESDLDTWAPIVAAGGYSGTLLGIAYKPIGAGRWVITGGIPNSLQTSDDGGLSWSERGSPAGDGGFDFLFTVAWSGTGSFFITAGPSAVMISYDGVDWMFQDPPAGSRVAAAANDDDGTALIVGESALIMTSDMPGQVADEQRPGFFRSFQHLLPDAQAWRLRLDSNRTIDRFFAGLAGAFGLARIFVDRVNGDLRPDSTRAFAEWEKQFDLPPIEDEADRRAQLATRWAFQGGQSPKFLQDLVQASGFPDVYIHEWWSSGPPYVARDPRPHTNNPLIGTVQCGEPLAQCGETGAQCNDLLANITNYLVNDLRNGKAPPPVPDDPASWPYFLYFGGETFPGDALIEPGTRQRLEEILLKHCPTQQWIVVMVTEGLP